jgi:hypothetical protein
MIQRLMNHTLHPMIYNKQRHRCATERNRINTNLPQKKQIHSPHQKKKNMRSGNQTLQLEIHRKSLRNGGFHWKIIEVDGGCAKATFDDGRVSSLQHKNVISHHWPITEPLRCKGPRPESSVQCNKTTRIGMS